VALEERLILKVEEFDDESLVGHACNDMPGRLLADHAFAADAHESLFDSARFLGKGGSRIRFLGAVGAGLAERLTLGRGPKVRRAGAVLSNLILGKDAVAPERSVSAARYAAERDSRAEIVRDSLPLFFRRRVQQPHQHEEGHHGGHEVGIGNLPRPAVVPIAADDLLALDDDWRGILLPGHSTTRSFHPGTGLARGV